MRVIEKICCIITYSYDDKLTCNVAAVGSQLSYEEREKVRVLSFPKTFIIDGKRHKLTEISWDNVDKNFRPWFPNLKKIVIPKEVTSLSFPFSCGSYEVERY